MSGFMFSVILPSTDAAAIAYVQDTLSTRCDIYMVYGSAVDVGTNQVTYFTRLSAQVYLELSDFDTLGKLVPQLLAEYSRL